MRRSTTSVRAASALAVLALVTGALAADAPADRDWRPGVRTLQPGPPAADVAGALRRSRADPKRLLTAGARFDPALGAPEVDPSLGFRAPPTAGGGPLLVQFSRAIRADDDDWLLERGFEVLRHVPNRAFLVRGDTGSAADLGAEARVRWVGPYRPEFKVRPELLRSDYSGRFFLEATLLPGGSAGGALAELRQRVAGASEVTRRAAPHGGSLRVEVDGSELRAAAVALANHPDVERVDLWTMPVPHNDHSIYVIQSYDLVNRLDYSQSATIWNHGILGTGQIVAVSDTRFDTDVCYFRYAGDGFAAPQDTVPPDPGLLDPSAKVLAHAILPGATADGANDHGTHVAGTVAGDSFLTASTPAAHGHDTGDGMAPQARLFLQGLSGPSGSLVGTLGDPYLLSLQAYDAGARIQTNSWGASVAGEAAPCDSTCMDKDRFSWDHEDFLHVFSIGNQDPFGSKDYLARPANAKNVLGVGATTHGSNDAAAPASFNAIGPALDGRVKPDVLAPGQDVNSAASNALAGDGNCSWKTISGTSMAAPTAAGAAALARQFYTDGFYPTGTATAADAIVPSAALLKATLLASAVDLGAQDVPADPVEGWGRILLDDVLSFPGDPERLRVWERWNAEGLTTGQVDDWSIEVGPGHPLTVALVWTDPPAAPAAAIDLVNDLDLEVVGPGGTYSGNAFVAGQSVTGGTADAINNVEKVVLDSPAQGAYTLRVRAADVPGNGFTPDSDRQGYALVVTHAACAGSPGGPPAGLTAVDQGASGVSLSWSGTASGYEVLRAEGTCAVPLGGFSALGSTAGTSFVDSSAKGGHDYAYRVRGADGCAAGPSSCAEATSTASCDLTPVFDGLVSASNATEEATCGIELAWETGATRCPAVPGLVYNVYRGTTPYFVPAAGNRVATGITGTSWTDPVPAGLVTYHYVVRAEDATSGNGGPANGGNEDGNLQVVHGTASAGATEPGTFADDGGDGRAWLVLERPWRVTDEENHTPGGGLSYKTGDDGATHRGSVCASATTPPIELGPGTPELSYWANYNMELGFDGIVVEISTDGGATWDDLPPDEVAGGVVERYPGYVSGSACLLPQYHGAINNPFTTGLGGWFEFVHELAEYAGRTVRIRWRFTSDGFVEYAGFYLDDIRITLAHAPRDCAAVSIEFDRPRYGCDDTITITARDANLAGAGGTTAGLSSNGETEQVTLVETAASSGVFTLDVGTTTAPPMTGDGLLSVAAGETISTDLASGVHDDAAIDCDPVEILNVRAVDVRHEGATVIWQTSDWADSVLRWGTSAPPGLSAPGTSPVKDHARALDGLAPCTTYLFEIEATDDAGNTAVDDAGGGYYSFTTGRNPFVTAASTDTPLAIPDLDGATGVTSSIAVAETRRIADLRVQLDVTHPSIWELDLLLTAPDGTEVLLSDNSGAILGANMSGTVFDDAAAETIDHSVPPYAFSYRPDEPLSAVDGIPAAGTWSLNARDGINIPPTPANTGQLDGWSLLFESGPEWCSAHATPVALADVGDSCDSAGPGDTDGNWDPGESVQFGVDVRNDGAATLNGVTATVTPLVRGAFMLDATASFGSIAPGQVVPSQAPHFTLQLPTGLDCRDTVRLLVDVSANEGSWSGTFVRRVGDGQVFCTLNRCNRPSPVPDGTTGTGVLVGRNDPQGTSLSVEWDVSVCGSPDYELLYGQLAHVSGVTPTGAVCDLGTAGAHVWSGVPAGDLWFLVVGDGDNGTEGSWGLDSGGSHRGGIAASGRCGNLGRDNDDDCD